MNYFTQKNKKEIYYMEAEEVRQTNKKDHLKTRWPVVVGQLKRALEFLEISVYALLA